MAFVLGSHGRIATIGEARGLNLDLDPETYMCSCGQRYQVCQFWKNIERCLQEMISPHVDLNELQTKFIPKSDRLVDRLQFKDLKLTVFERIRDYMYRHSGQHRSYIEEIILHCRYLAEAVGQRYGKDIFLDTSKTPEAIFHLDKHLKCDFKVIYLIRDGRGVFNSYIKKKKDLDEHQMVKRWVKVNKKIERVVKKISSEKVHFVTYSDFCREPEMELRKMFTFIGVPHDERCLRFWDYEHHIIGNNFRLNVQREIQHDEHWKNSLSPRHLRLFQNWQEITTGSGGLIKAAGKKIIRHITFLSVLKEEPGDETFIHCICCGMCDVHWPGRWHIDG